MHLTGTFATPVQTRAARGTLNGTKIRQVCAAGHIARLKAHGFASDALAPVDDPVGLTIGAKTSAEIAVSSWRR